MAERIEWARKDEDVAVRRCLGGRQDGSAVAVRRRIWVWKCLLLGDLSRVSRWLVGVFFPEERRHEAVNAMV